MKRRTVTSTPRSLRRNVDRVLLRRRRRDAVGEKSEEKSSQKTGGVGDVVDVFHGVDDEDVDAHPEDELADQIAAPPFVTVSRRMESREDERAGDAEDG